MWEYAKDSDQVLEAVSRPERLRIIQSLSDGPLPLRALRERIGRSYSDLLHHLAVLQKAGLVEVLKLRPRLTMAYLKYDVDVRVQTGKKPVVKLRKREPPVESDLMKSYWKLLLQT